MSITIQTRRVRKVRIHCPILDETLTAIARGEMDAIERDPTAAAMLAIIRADNPLGDFAGYHGVFELGLGVESFMPTADATPTHGMAGSLTHSPTAIITTYVDVDANADAALAALMAAHPWEVPVIEFGEEIALLVRG